MQKEDVDTAARDQKPPFDLSVILITPDSYQTIRRTVEALQRQTCSERLEVVLVGPSPEELDVEQQDLDGFGGHQIVGLGKFRSAAEARAAGVRAATAPVVAFTEDHAFPEPGWAEALIERHAEAWSGVGPVFLNLNPGTASSWASFVMEHGEWVAPAPQGPCHTISGSNSSYKRAALLEYREHLPDMLKCEAAMQWDMNSKGHTFYIEPAARCYHLNYSAFWSTIGLRFRSGREFAARRARSWSPLRRGFYALASPLIPLIRLVRASRVFVRIGQGKRLPAVLPPLCTFLLTSGLGEAFGYAFGERANAPGADGREFHRERYLIESEREKTGSLTDMLSLCGTGHGGV